MMSPEELRNTCLDQLEARLTPDRVKNYPGAYTYAAEVSKAVSGVLVENITRTVFGGYIPQEYADAAIYDTLEAGYIKTAKAAQKAHKALYFSENIGLDAFAADMDTERATNLVNALVNAENWHEINALLTDSTMNFVESAVLATLKRNIDREATLGFNRQVRREKHTTKQCTFCDPLCGTFDYEDVPDDFWKRHKICSCTIIPVNFTAKREWAGNRLAKLGK